MWWAALARTSAGRSTFSRWSRPRRRCLRRRRRGCDLSSGCFHTRRLAMALREYGTHLWGWGWVSIDTMWCAASSDTASSVALYANVCLHSWHSAVLERSEEGGWAADASLPRLKEDICQTRMRAEHSYCHFLAFDEGDHIIDCPLEDVTRTYRHLDGCPSQQCLL